MNSATAPQTNVLEFGRGNPIRARPAPCCGGSRPPPRPPSRHESSRRSGWRRSPKMAAETKVSTSWGPRLGGSRPAARDPSSTALGRASATDARHLRLGCVLANGLRLVIRGTIVAPASRPRGRRDDRSHLASGRPFLPISVGARRSRSVKGPGERLPEGRHFPGLELDPPRALRGVSHKFNVGMLCDSMLGRDILKFARLTFKHPPCMLDDHQRHTSTTAESLVSTDVSTCDKVTRRRCNGGDS